MLNAPQPTTLELTTNQTKFGISMLKGYLLKVLLS